MSDLLPPIYCRIRFSEAFGHRLFSYGKPMKTACCLPWYTVKDGALRAAHLRGCCWIEQD
jgi:hypothetical protein